MLTLRLFSILAGFGAAIGLWRVYRSVPAGVGSRQWICAVFALLGVLTGARVGYVLAHPFYYSLHPEQAVQFWLGGFNAFGAFAGAALFTLLGGAALRLNVLSALDSTSRMLLPIATLIWLGLWYEGVAYGQALPSGAFLSYPALDETGMLSNRFPLQLVAGLSLLLLLGLIEHIIQFKRPGFRFSLVSLGFFTHMLVFSLFRADAVFPIRGIRSDGLLALIFAVAFALLSVLLLLTAARKKDKMKSEENV